MMNDEFGGDDLNISEIFLTNQHIEKHG